MLREGLLIKIIFLASFILLGIASILFYIDLGDVENFFIVKFDALRGINFLGGRGEVIGILLSAWTIGIINALLSWAFYRRERFLAYIFPFFTFFFAILILIGIGVIIASN